MNNITEYLRLYSGYGYIFALQGWRPVIIWDNIHKHPVISKLMCKLGRHDFEYGGTEIKAAKLECFYCEKKKTSHRL